MRWAYGSGSPVDCPGGYDVPARDLLEHSQQLRGFLRTGLWHRDQFDIIQCLELVEWILLSMDVYGDMWEYLLQQVQEHPFSIPSCSVEPQNPWRVFEHEHIDDPGVQQLFFLFLIRILCEYLIEEQIPPGWLLHLLARGIRDVWDDPDVHQCACWACFSRNSIPEDSILKDSLMFSEYVPIEWWCVHVPCLYCLDGHVSSYSSHLSLTWRVSLQGYPRLGDSSLEFRFWDDFPVELPDTHEEDIVVTVIDDL